MGVVDFVRQHPSLQNAVTAPFNLSPCEQFMSGSYARKKTRARTECIVCG